MAKKPSKGPPPRDYEVGFGKPPKATRFKPGKSGNPKGRPKGAPNHGTEIRNILIEPVQVVRNGKPKIVTAFTAMLLQLRQKALAGDVRAIQTLLELAERHGLSLDGVGEIEPLSDEARRLIEDHLALLKKRDLGSEAA